jgi:acyl transferase domain-containing protein
MFAGQGCQYYGMGRELFEQQPVFRAHLERLDRAAADLTGRSIIEQVYFAGRRSSDAFDDLLLSNPAIFMVEYALARTLLDHGLTPDVTLGASLGSFAAMAISGILDEQQALAAVIRLADAVVARAPGGAMIAVLAPVSLAGEAFLRDRSEIAAINFDSHFILSVGQAQVAEVEAYLGGRDILFQRLPVAFAFHSSAVECLRPMLENLSGGLDWRPAHTAFACCATSAVLTRLPPDYFWQLVRRPIMFRDTIDRLEQLHPFHYVDASPTGTLATLLKYLLPPAASARISQTFSPFGADADNVLALIDRLAPAGHV